jgi:hypothetical protein
VNSNHTDVKVEAAPVKSPTFGPYWPQTINDEGGFSPTTLPTLSVSNVQPWATYEIVNNPTGWNLTIDPNTWEMTWDWDIHWTQNYNITIKVTNPNNTTWQITFNLNVYDNA